MSGKGLFVTVRAEQTSILLQELLTNVVMDARLRIAYDPKEANDNQDQAFPHNHTGLE